MTDHRLLTPDELAAIRDYITGWEPARDRRFLEAARTLLDHADAQDAELARLRDALGKVCDAAMEGYGTTCCTLCYDWTVTAEGEFHHAPDCPVAAARRVLEGGA